MDGCTKNFRKVRPSAFVKRRHAREGPQGCSGHLETAGHEPRISYQAERAQAQIALSIDSQFADCHFQVGRTYRGTQSLTEEGFTCQEWSSQTPQRHSFSDDTAFYWLVVS